MSVESTTIAFPGQLADGQIRGSHSRPWDRVLEQLQIDAGAAPPSGGPLVFQVNLPDLSQSASFSLANGAVYAELPFTGDGLAVPAGTIVQVQCLSASGASDVIITLIGSTRVFGDALFGDAESQDESAMTLTAFLTAQDVNNSIASSQLIELLDDPANPTGAINTTIRDALLARVQGEIEGALKRRYLLPLIVPTADAASVLATIGGQALALFRFYAMEGKAHLLAAYPGVQTTFKYAKAWLANVRDGAEYISAKLLSGAPARTAAAQDATHDGTFNRERMKGW